MRKRLNSSQLRKARKARQIGKKVLEMKWNGNHLVKGNMTFYFDNVLIQTKNTYPFDEIVLYIELDGTRCRENIEVLMGGASEYKRKHLEKRMLDRVLSPEEIEKVVREGLTVLDCRSLDGRPGVHYNTYYYMDDKCVVGTVINKGHTVVVNTAYRITPVGDIGFLSDQVNWLIKRIGYKSSISRCYVIDRTASGEYAQNELVRMIPGILSSVASLSPHERKAWAQNKTVRHIMDQTQKLKASLNVVPWDSQNNLGTSFETRPDHDYSFVVEVDNNEVVYADAPGVHALSEASLDPAGANTEVIKLDDVYLSAIIDWVLYRAFSKDAEHAANASRAGAHHSAFISGIGDKTKSDVSSAPTEAI